MLNDEQYALFKNVHDRLESAFNVDSFDKLAKHERLCREIHRSPTHSLVLLATAFVGMSLIILMAMLNALQIEKLAVYIWMGFHFLGTSVITALYLKTANKEMAKRQDELEKNVNEDYYKIAHDHPLIEFKALFKPDNFKELATGSMNPVARIKEEDWLKYLQSSELFTIYNYMSYEDYCNLLRKLTTATRWRISEYENNKKNILNQENVLNLRKMMDLD